MYTPEMNNDLSSEKSPNNLAPFHQTLHLKLIIYQPNSLDSILELVYIFLVQMNFKLESFILRILRRIVFSNPPNQKSKSRDDTEFCVGKNIIGDENKMWLVIFSR